ncbi:MAG: SpoIIE family protein phosphatase [Labilithrix sp.]|nr:SpoIIE family protein phosphatase [Labilithrix sp.]
MSRVLVVLGHAENRRLLADWLSAHYEVRLAEHPEAFDEPFDLGIVDWLGLERYGPRIEAAKRSVQPIYLPFLLVTHRQGLGPGSARQAWERVDELIYTPVEKIELGARVEMLLRARELSLLNAALRQKLELELARAGEVQAALLPRCAPALRGIDLAARCIPAREVSGDFFDWQSNDEAVTMTVGDVMGKGMPAALLAATVRAALRTVARHHDPGAALDLVRESLSGDLEHTSSFATLFHARVACANPGASVRYVDAGHGHAFVRTREGDILRLARGGRPVGFPAAAPYRESTLTLREGDVLFVHSDGLVETAETTAVTAPAELVAGLDMACPAARIVEEVLDRALRRPPFDDATILVVKCAA